MLLLEFYVSTTLPYPAIDPVAFALGPLTVHWYGVMYLLAFGCAWWLAKLQARWPNSPIAHAAVDDLIVWGAWGVILGGRIGYVVFYNAPAWVADPLLIVKIWQGGMSFHGGLIGVVVALLWYARKHRLSAVALFDFAAPLVPTGLLFGRLGNFIGQELWGRPTDVSWAMVFPMDPLQLPRHPSQLYEAFLEGALLFALLWWFASKPRLRGQVGGLFLFGYGVGRFAVEFFREPDQHIAANPGLIAGLEWMTRGQWLCLPMIVIGLWLLTPSRLGKRWL